MADEIEQEVEELETETSEVEEEAEVVEATEEETEIIPEEEEELIISIDGEEPKPEEEEHQEAPQWVKDLRKSSREDKKRIRDLEKQVATKEESTETVLTLGKKPTMEDHGYDADEFEKALDEYHEQKKEYDKAQDQVKVKEEDAAKAWQTVQDEYGKKKAAINVADFDDVEGIVKDTLSVQQQGMIMEGAKNPALVVYAIGKNPKKAEELKAITNPVKFIFAVAELENKMKTTRRKAATSPERKVTGSTSSTNANDSKLTKLDAEASESGDYTKYHAYKRSLKAKKT